MGGCHFGSRSRSNGSSKKSDAFPPLPESHPCARDSDWRAEGSSVGKGDHYQPLRASHVRATRCADRSYAMVYIPQAEQTITVDLSSLSGKVKAWWYDPRNGKSHNVGEYPNKGNVKFTTPIAGPDWVLLLDYASKIFQPPHSSRINLHICTPKN
jgi:hypothetical protein